jgi:hypothetical protein
MLRAARAKSAPALLDLIYSQTAVAHLAIDDDLEVNQRK